MASQTPSTVEVLQAGVAAPATLDEYLRGWAALAELIERDVSWSGHERNCAFSNRGDGTFADVSAISGLDFDDDGRACVALDLDQDGDLDLLFKNRSGPQLRVLANEQFDDRSALAVRLVDPTCKNRDAIGARVTVRAGDHGLVRFLVAGDGYLSQSSRWLHFGSVDATSGFELTVRWPDGESERITKQQFDADRQLARLTIVRGRSATWSSAATRTPLPTTSGAAKPAPPDREAIVLRNPLPLSPTLQRAAFRGPPRRPALLGLWAMGNAESERAITAFAGSQAALETVAVDVVLLGLHDGAEQAAAARRFVELAGDRTPGMRQRPASAAMRECIDALVTAIVGPSDAATEPATYLLVDGQGRAQVLYRAAPTVAELRYDVARFGGAQVDPTRRSRRSGRWAFAVPRALGPLVRDLAARGLRRDAAFYQQLDAARRGDQPPK